MCETSLWRAAEHETFQNFQTEWIHVQRFMILLLYRYKLQSYKIYDQLNSDLGINNVSWLTWWHTSWICFDFSNVCKDEKTYIYSVKL